MEISSLSSNGNKQYAFQGYPCAFSKCYVQYLSVTWTLNVSVKQTQISSATLQFLWFDTKLNLSNEL